MAYTDFLTYQYVDNPANLPNDWPAYTKTVVDTEEPIEENWQRMTDEDFASYISDVDRVSRFEAAQTFYQNSRILKITSLIDDRFVDLPPNKIDFRRHLKDGIVLTKTVIMADNGRPVRAEYTNGSDVIGRIQFDFSTNDYNLVTRRTEKLGYYNLNGDIVQDYIISDEVWDLTQTYYLAKAVNERHSARSKIFDEVKAYINVIMLQSYLTNGKTYQDVLSDGYNFWKEYSSDIDAWFHIGASGPFITRLAADTQFAFLDLPINANNTIRQWIINRVTY